MTALHILDFIKKQSFDMKSSLLNVGAVTIGLTGEIFMYVELCKLQLPSLSVTSLVKTGTTWA